MNKSYRKSLLACATIGLSMIANVSATAGTIVLGGTNNGNLAHALTTLGYAYTNLSPDMAPDPVALSLGAGDTIILGNDGGIDSLLDYTSFLNSGGRVIVAGGSNTNDYRNWVSLYFNTTDTGSGWHTDGGWTEVAPIATLPDTYTFENNSSTYHMVGFNATVDTVLYGKNGENVHIAAVRSYANGGYFDYMALDIGVFGYATDNDRNNFIIPWLQGALNNEHGGSVTVPDAASTSGLLLLGLASLFAFARRNSRA